MNITFNPDGSQKRTIMESFQRVADETNKLREIINEDELTDMFGEGGKEEVKEAFDPHNIIDEETKRSEEADAVDELNAEDFKIKMKQYENN